MAKKVTVEVEVNSSQVDQTVNKLGQLRDLGRGLKIQYDIDGRPVDIVIDKTLNLQKQAKILTAELRRTKEGTAEFQMLSSKLGEVQDGLARTKVKSGDLFTSLQLLPGPIGQFASQINGAIALLKTFSGFSLKDLRFQLKETADDIGDIIDNIFGLGKATTESGKIAGNIKDAAATTLNTGAEKLNTVAIAENTKEQVLNSDAKLVDAADTAINTNELNKNSLAVLDNKILVKSLAVEYLDKRIAVTQDTLAQNGLTTSTELNTLVQEKNTKITQLSTLQTERDALAKTVNTGATNALTTATSRLVAILTSAQAALLGIVTAIGIGIFKFYQWVTATSAADEATKSLKETLVKGATAAEEARNKVLEVGVAFEQAKKGAISKKKALETYNEVLGGTIGKADTLAEAEKLYNSNTENYIKATGLRAQAQELFRIAAQKSAEAVSAEQVGFFSFDRGLFESYDAELQRRRKKLDDTSTELRKSATNLLKEAATLETGFKPKTEDSKNEIKKIEDDNKKANELLLKLKQENTVALLNEERKKQDAQLKIDKENEEREIMNLKLTKDKEELRAKLLEQIRFKYGLKVIELNKKRQEEDNKAFDEQQQKVKEYNDKIFEIMNNADQNELSRNKAARTRKFEDDKAALEKDLNFQKETLENKIRILMALEKAYKNDLEKLDNDENQKNRENALRRLDDELRFLQIRGEAIIQGTREYFNNLREISKKSEERELKSLDDRAIREKLTTEQVEAEKTAIKQKYANERINIDRQELNAYLQFANSILSQAQNTVSSISEINQMQQEIDLQKAEGNAEKQEEIKKKYFEKNKKTQIAQAIIGTLQGAVQAYQSLAVIPVVGPALGAAAAAAALIFGYKKVDLIRQQQYQSSSAGGSADAAKPQLPNFGRNYEKGGMIGGKRHAEGGTLIEAEKGEAIMTRGAVTMFAPLLSAMNQMGGGTSFAPSLMTTSFDAPITSKPSQEQAPIIVKSYVVSSELTSEQNKQARLKDLSTL